MNIREGHLVSPEGDAVVAGRVRSSLLGYLALTKPRVIELLLVTTIPAMLLADRGSVDLVLILNTLFGGGGIHHCLGNQLARRQLAATFRELLTRLPDIEVVGEPTLSTSNFFHGVNAMTVRFTPEAAR